MDYFQTLLTRAGIPIIIAVVFIVIHICLFFWSIIEIVDFAPYDSDSTAKKIVLIIFPIILDFLIPIASLSACMTNKYKIISFITTLILIVASLTISISLVYGEFSFVNSVPEIPHYDRINYEREDNCCLVYEEKDNINYIYTDCYLTNYTTSLPLPSSCKEVDNGIVCDMNQLNVSSLCSLHYGGDENVLLVFGCIEIVKVIVLIAMMTYQSYDLFCKTMNLSEYIRLNDSE